MVELNLLLFGFEFAVLMVDDIYGLADGGMLADLSVSQLHYEWCIEIKSYYTFNRHKSLR